MQKIQTKFERWGFDMICLNFYSIFRITQYYIVSEPDAGHMVKSEIGAGHIVKREVADRDEKEDEDEEEALFRKRFSVPKDDDNDEKRMADDIKMEDSDRLTRHLTVSRMYLNFKNKYRLRTTALYIVNLHLHI